LAFSPCECEKGSDAGAQRLGQGLKILKGGRITPALDETEEIHRNLGTFRELFLGKVSYLTK